jgi:hypothetical protein
MLAAVVVGGLGLSTALPAAASAPLGVRDQTVVSAPARAALQPGSYKVASFNVLGYSHTLGGARGFADGVTRIGWAKQLLDAHRVSVAGFQELQAPQVTRFLQITAGSWALYPGLSVHGVDSDNSIGWRTDKFTLVRATTVKIPYFDGIPRSMPVVLLRHKASGMMTYFANFHNPADTALHANQGQWRLEASRIEIALQNQLVTQGIPRIMTGDMNERAPYFCRVTRDGTPLHAARPGSVRVDGVCHPGRPRFVDWIFGSLRATFSYYTEDDGALDHRTTDHPVIVSRVTVSPEALPRGWATSPPAPFVPRVSS